MQGCFPRPRSCSSRGPVKRPAKREQSGGVNKNKNRNKTFQTKIIPQHSTGGHVLFCFFSIRTPDGNSTSLRSQLGARQQQHVLMPPCEWRSKLAETMREQLAAFQTRFTSNFCQIVLLLLLRLLLRFPALAHQRT